MKKMRYYAKKYFRQAITFYKKYSVVLQSQKAKTVISKIPGRRTAQIFINRYKLFFGITLAVCISLLLTVFSLSLYVITGTSKLDLSRPGYEEVRQKVEKAPLRENAFEPNGPLDSKIINDYLVKYKKQSQTLEKYDTFDPKLLDDAPLGLTPDQSVATDPANP